MQIFDNQSAFRPLSAVPCPLEKLALPVNTWAGKGKNKHPLFHHSSWLSLISWPIFPFSCLNPFFCLLIFPSCTMFIQASQPVPTIWTRSRFVCSDYYQTIRKNKKTKRTPFLSLIFFESFFPNILALVSTRLSQTMSLERSERNTRSGKWIAMQRQRFWSVRCLLVNAPTQHPPK